MDFKSYIEHFTGNKINPLPGEHHFVSLCLVPLLVEQIGNKNINKIEYINPDGMKNLKNRVVCDITYDQVGIEVKYSKNNSLRFTAKQLIELDKLKDSAFAGFIALVNSGCKTPNVRYISKIDFYSHYSQLIRERKDKKYISIKVDDNWKKLTEADFTALFQ
jgi:hypothetical protein